jgi:succinate dehydrogenase / fumarate reductase iron-sulfur subunit
MKNVIYQVQRFDGEKKWLQEYSISYEAGKTILWGLQQIKDYQDPTLKFIAYCQSAICGSCAVCVNGNSVLACQTSLDEMLTEYRTDTLRIEPLRNFAVIRDLIVDWAPKVETMKKVAPWLLCPDDHDHSQGFIQTNDDIKKFTDATDCILCGICASECERIGAGPVGFYEPFVFTKAFRFAADSRDDNPTAHIGPAVEAGGLWECLQCMRCINSCPKAVRPADYIQWLRERSLQTGHAQHKGCVQATRIVEQMKTAGRLTDELLRPDFKEPGNQEQTEGVRK